ncbi:MAG: PP2C family protein-serine/threonine phosphatase [Ignavibacteria bacterium]|nr:PP2C family protein-serine/threonine phosphatase [Ignavibacteria bacterium]
MRTDFSNNRYWLISALAVFGLIMILYPLNIYNGLNLKTTRPQAIETAKDFLKAKKVNIEGFEEEAFLDNSPIEIKYILKQLGNEDFKKYHEKKKWSNLSWMVMIHQNLPRQIQQSTYWIDISSDGKVFGFRMNIPDSLSLPSLSKQEATNLVENYLQEEIGEDFNEYKLIETREENLRARTDYSFRWEKDEPILNAKIVITSRVNGNSVGSFSHYFEVPQSEREYFEADLAIFGTGSVIFVVILILIAFYLFLKKYHQGEVWINVGRTMFLIYFLMSIVSLINFWPAIGLNASIGNLSFTNVRIIFAIINGLIVNFFIALLIFASWTVGESYARSLWPNKLKGTDAFLKGHIFALDSGSSLLKGFVLGSTLAMSYLVIGIIVNQPNASIFISPAGFFENLMPWFPALSIVLDSASFAILSAVVVTFFIVNISYQRWKKKWISIVIAGLVTSIGFVIASTPPSLNDLTVNIFAWFIFGSAVAYLYFMFDLLTLISLHFTAGIISRSYILVAADNPFFTINLIIVAIVLLTIPIIYFISRIKNEEFILESYGLPAHVQRISERERLRKEMEIAAKVQLSLLPKEELKIPGYDIASTSIPAVEAGGDYFDFVKLSGNKIGIAIGDVSGKGIGAAIYMTLTKGILQAHAEENVSPSNVLTKVNRLLYKTIEKNSFVSMFYAILDVNNNSLLYSRAGHNPAILCSKKGMEPKLLLSKGMALGLEEGSKFTSTLNEEEINLDSGDVVVLYTDGFTEAMNEKQEQYGEKKLVDLIENNKGLNSRDLLNLILKDVKRFVDNYPQHDDMTMVVLKRS